MRLITTDDLMFGKKGLGAKVLSRSLMGVLGLNKANRLYSRTYDAEDYTSALLRHLGIEYRFDGRDMANIPDEGAAIVICNHPTGAMDGIVLIDAISRKRPDVRFMGNFLLDRIEPLRDHIIPVDPFDSKARATNVKGLKQSMEHLAGGGLLAIFPAGEVATWQHGFKDVRDKQWDPAVLRFIRRCGAPVVPLYIEARNSTMFRLVGKIDPKLRTAMLPHELFNKDGKSVRILAGTAINPKKVAELDEKQYAGYLRASVDYLAASIGTGGRRRRRRKFLLEEVDTADIDFSGIVARPAQADMDAELEKIRDRYLLFENAGQALYCAPTAEIPVIMTEIGRMREISFREVGEGTMKEIDIDRFDAYYRQLFLWDKDAGCIIGAYRMGFGDEIMPKYGIAGFYTDTLFRYSPEMGPVLEKTIELGRSFIAKEYRRRPNSLMMLWKGILYVLLKHDQFRNLLGPVTISGEFTPASKMVIATWLRGRSYNEKLAAYISPVNGMKGIRTDIDLSLIEGIDSVDLIAKLVADIEHEQRTVPVLVKKYLGLNSTVLGFNVDHDFCDGLDALMLLDMKHMPEASVNMLSREIADIDVLARLRQYG